MTEIRRCNRRRQMLTLKGRLLESRERARTLARQMAPCREREGLIRKARLAETTAALENGYVRPAGARRTKQRRELLGTSAAPAA
jgi:hypothetical protein